jgi:fatty aldehyde-generating acyl-ACP reductase
MANIPYFFLPPYLFYAIISTIMKKFSFLIHPRDISDVKRPIPWAKYFPNLFVDKAISILPKRLSVYPWKSFDVYGKTEGWIIVVFLTGEQMITLPRRYVQDRILEATLLAQNKLGAELVGLGAYTAPLTDGGHWLVKQSSVKINITHGDSFSTAIAAEGIRKIAHDFHINLKEKKIAIVGAYGLIGSALTTILAKECGTLQLIGRNEIKLARLKKSLGDPIHVVSSTDITTIIDSDIVVTSTSHPGSLLKPQLLKKNAIVYDIAQPQNVTKEVCQQRPDIVRIDGCYASIPNIELGAEMGPPAGATFSCLAETIMQALDDDHQNYVGEIEQANVNKTIERQRKYGFYHAPFTNFSEKLDLTGTIYSS